MYCGSCLRDNSLVAGLASLGWDVTLLPLYTPIRVDENDRSVDQVFFGGINVFLQQKIPLFRHLPAFLDRWLDHPALLRRVAARAVSISPKELGAMTLSMVKGENGFQRKEVARLIHWLKETARPDLICLTNLLVGGSIPALKRELGVPVVVTLQGDDVFLDELEEPWRSRVLRGMKRLAREVDHFLTFSEYYRRHISGILGIPERKFHVVPLGVPVAAFEAILRERRSRPAGQVIGYFARLAPEKGFDLVISAFLEVARRHPQARLHVGGWLAEKDRAFFAGQLARVEAAGLMPRFHHVEAPDGAAKEKFFAGLDVFTVPARFVEPKGIYVLEAMASGLPVVAPDRGAFSEMIPASAGGLLCRPEDPNNLADRLCELLSDPKKAAMLGQNGRTWVERVHDRQVMATATAGIFTEILSKE
jgi:glycosyltransferase involved in cell wall biosynthesis